jgi:hypothetical protein
LGTINLKCVLGICYGSVFSKKKDVGSLTPLVQDVTYLNIVSL